MICVLDASAMIAFLRGETGGDKVQSLLLDSSASCHAHAVNLCEVFYDLYRSGGEDEAQIALRNLSSIGIVFHEELDSELWMSVGRLKGRLRRISLADCFCIALEQRLVGEVVTTDHHEFDRIVPLGLCPIRFIR